MSNGADTDSTDTRNTETENRPEFYGINRTKTTNYAASVFRIKFCSTVSSSTFSLRVCVCVCMEPAQRPQNRHKINIFFATKHRLFSILRDRASLAVSVCQMSVFMCVSCKVAQPMEAFLPGTREFIRDISAMNPLPIFSKNMNAPHCWHTTFFHFHNASHCKVGSDGDNSVVPNL